jgi:zinc transport system substrate-binding protein
MIVMTGRRLLLAASAALAVALLSACGTAQGDSGASKVEVVAAFYPLQYAVEQIGGPHVNVATLTKPGGEPHDVELTPRQVGRVATADLVVYERGFQPAVDAAVSREARHVRLDVSDAARLETFAAEDAHAHQGQTSEPDASPNVLDPHFWLDPQRYADVGDAIAHELATRDPANAAAYDRGAARFRATMLTLDAQYRAGLTHCASQELVTSHAAFGYLAERYGLHQEGITGLDPEAEPDPATLARVVAHIRASGARTVYAETLVSHEVAATLARETGVQLAVLDPIEGVTRDSAGQDYPSIMRANLATLRNGQGCR